MPLQLRSRPTTDTIRSRSPSPFATPTPASQSQIPTIRLTSATPCNTNSADDTCRDAPQITSEATPIPIAPKSSTTGETSRKRLVLKKSKLSLLASSALSAKTRERDSFGVAASVQDQSDTNGFDIYIDPANDPDIGDILVVKKKKSRLGLDGMHWGALEETTNVPSVTKPKEKEGKRESLLRAKVDENQKWWSIGRGRKDSKGKDKDKGKDQERARSPQLTDNTADKRARYNSLDSGMLLTGPISAELPEPLVEGLRAPTLPLATQAPPSAPGLGSGKDSVAIRAMRSVRSLARIGSWAQLKNTPNPDATSIANASVKEKVSDAKKKKKKKDKDKEKEKEKDRNGGRDRAQETIRHSGSSFEAGALSTSPVGSKYESRSLGKKKASILGLGLPSTMRLPSSRNGSAASSIVAMSAANNRLSVDSADLLGGGILVRGRSGSAMSTASSVRPMSTKSRESSGSSGAASVKWDEAGLQTVKELRRKERERKNKEKAKEKSKEETKEETKETKEKTKEKTKKSKKSKSKKDSTRKSSGSRRTPLAAIFPGAVLERDEEPTEEPPATPIIIIGAATADGHGSAADLVDPPTPALVECERPRSVPEQPFARSRPNTIHAGDKDNVALSLLDAATNELARLINKLDLQATPGSMEVTPLGRHSSFLPGASANSQWSNRLTSESPVKGLCRRNLSMTSLKPYSQSCSKGAGNQLGQNIAPWSTLNRGISPSTPSPSTIRVNFQDNMATVRTHRQTMTPTPAADPSPVFKALRPATVRLPISKTVLSTSSGISPFMINPVDRSPSALTFGSGHSKSESRGSLATSPVFKKPEGHTRKRSAVIQPADVDSYCLPLLPEARRSLGLAGTLGGSVGSIAEQECDESDPDSDIPDELLIILSNSDQEDTISFKPKPADPPPSPGLPPELPLPELDILPLRDSLAESPIYRAAVTVEDEHKVGAEEAGTISEDDTKKSFDFTGELQRLNESGASDRRSFIEQLESAFRTPTKIDLHYDLGDAPPVPKLPSLQDELSRVGESLFNLPIDYESRELSSEGFPVDAHAAPSLFSGLDSCDTIASNEESHSLILPQFLPNAAGIASQPSIGELNRNFKFGGKRPSSSEGETSLTLSDIIPPLEIARCLSVASLSDDEGSFMKSILANAVEIKSPSGSQGESIQVPRGSPTTSGRQRHNSALGFAGFHSFAEPRQGFEFNDGRRGFYPLPGATSNKRNRKRESAYSIASVSSYGNVLHGGSADPFDYASIFPLPSLRERPSSDDFSFTMSTSVDDTFSFVRRPPLRRRVDSDASSFYFRSSLAVHPYNRGQRRPLSGTSVGPPVSFFNRNSIYHRRGDSSTSLSSIAQSYANCRRFSWAHDRSNESVESVLSDFSGGSLGRPGLGDKMLDSALERSASLVPISTSPTSSFAASACGEHIHLEEYENHESYDSAADSRCESQKTDSLFEKTGNRNSVCSSDSAFFEGDMDNDALKPPRYRPISSLSIPSVHTPPKEDDTMISMLGGGRVRRRSVTSMIGSSPCMQVERRKNILANPPETVFSRIQKADPKDQESPPIPHVLESKPSIASTAGSSKFGDERVIRAKHGLLERQSLENTAPIGAGEESFRMPVFTRPTRTNRSRSSTCTSSSGADTPPLSISDGCSSFSEGSLSSIDLPQLNVLLSNATHPLSNASFDRARPYARGQRHRISQARASRTSIYEIIEEEHNSPLSPMTSPEHTAPHSSSNTVKLTEATEDPSRQVYVLDPETSSVESFSLWDDEQGITALRRYYALRNEAEDVITESKRMWLDTPFSVFAVQSFDPPHHPSGIQAMLEHSLRNYGPLPSELRPRPIRSRANSRPSPYPRTVKTSFTSSPATAEHLRATVVASLGASAERLVLRQSSPLSNALQPITVNANVPSTLPTESKDCVNFLGEAERVFRLPPRPRVASATRRAAPGWPKRSSGRNGVENKENSTTIGNVGSKASTAANVSQGSMTTPSDGLRLNRPRPKRRTTPAPAKPMRA